MKQYEEHVHNRMKELKQLFADENLLPMIEMDNPKYYRYKAQATFSTNKRGKIFSGFYEPGTHRLLPIDSSVIEEQDLRSLIDQATEVLKRLGYQAYDEDTREGLIRHIQLRKGYHTGEIMMILITYDKVLPGRKRLVQELRKLEPGITTILQNINDRDTNALLGKEYVTLYGPGFIYDELCGYRFKISPGAFYQVNPKMAKVLYETAIDFAKITKDDLVIDAYCGTGTIGIIAAKNALRVIGVDGSKAIKDANKNKQLNKVKNIYFYQEDATEFLVKVKEAGEKADVMILDPSRDGSTKEFLNSIHPLGIDRIVYISCNPHALKRDLKVLSKHYQVEKIQPIDMFPFTDHVECIALLRRVKW